MEKVNNVFKICVGVVMSWLGILAIPVMLLVGCNIIDYVTGLIASKNRNEKLSSKKGMMGIIKKICMWLLVLIGSWVDILIQYSAENIGIDWKLPFLIGSVTCIWLVGNEILSILENMVDIGVKLPPFLMPIVKRIQKATEEVANTEEKEN